MKRELHKLGIVIIAAVAFQIANSNFGVCYAAESTRFAEVRQLVAAQGNDYKTLRDSLVKAGAKWNQELALKEGWEAGLAVAILNARIDHRDAFDKLDLTSLSTDHSGRQRFLPQKEVGMEYETFAIEQFWKCLWPNDVRNSKHDEIVRAVMRPTLEGPISEEGQAKKLWMALSDPAVKPQLRAIGIYASCRYQECRQPAEEALGDGSAPFMVKFAAITGMFTYKSPFRLDVIVEKTSKMKDNLSVIQTAINELGKDSDKKSRELLYRWIADSSFSQVARGTIFNEFSYTPQPGDIEVLRSVLSQGNLPAFLQNEIYSYLKDRKGPMPRMGNSTAE
jgi:hypothetical protein